MARPSRTKPTKLRASGGVGLEIATDLLSQARLIRVASRVYPFFDELEASRCYRAAIEALDLGGRDAPPCEILDGHGEPIGFVSYNGRVWAGRVDAPISAVRVFDPRS